MNTDNSNFKQDDLDPINQTDFGATDLGFRYFFDMLDDVDNKADNMLPILDLENEVYDASFNLTDADIPQSFGELEEQISDNNEVNQTKSELDSKVNGRIKRPPSSYMLFSQEHHKQVRESRNIKDTCEVGRLMGQIWKGLDAKDKEFYKERSNEKRIEYNKLMATKPAGVMKTKRSKKMKAVGKKMAEQILETSTSSVESIGSDFVDQANCIEYMNTRDGSISRYGLASTESTSPNNLLTVQQSNVQCQYQNFNPQNQQQYLLRQCYPQQMVLQQPLPQQPLPQQPLPQQHFNQNRYYVCQQTQPGNNFPSQSMERRSDTPSQITPFNQLSLGQNRPHQNSQNTPTQLMHGSDQMQVYYQQRINPYNLPLQIKNENIQPQIKNENSPMHGPNYIQSGPSAPCTNLQYNMQSSSPVAQASQCNYQRVMAAQPSERNLMQIIEEKNYHISRLLYMVRERDAQIQYLRSALQPYQNKEMPNMNLGNQRI